MLVAVDSGRLSILYINLKGRMGCDGVCARASERDNEIIIIDDHKIFGLKSFT